MSDLFCAISHKFAPNEMQKDSTFLKNGGQSE